MKKFLFLTMVFGAVVSASHAQSSDATASAQTKESRKVQSTNTAPAPDFEAMLQKAKEQQVPQLVEKLGFTAAQAEKVIEINFAMRKEAATALQGLSDADRSAKLAEMKAAKQKKLAEVLSAEQLTALNNYYEEMGKNAQPTSRN